MQCSRQTRPKSHPYFFVDPKKSTQEKKSGKLTKDLIIHLETLMLDAHTTHVLLVRTFKAKK